jgi:hypothetical protein
MVGTNINAQQQYSAFNALMPGASLARKGDVYHLSKATIVRGEDDFPSGSTRVLDCHDAVIYCLAPLQHCMVSCCSDCVVVLGAVGNSLRVERCERVQVGEGTDPCDPHAWHRGCMLLWSFLVDLLFSFSFIPPLTTTRPPNHSMQIIAVSRHITINTCHDCICYLAVNRPPLVLGDNRFLQLAPYNAGYETLQEHMSRVGVTAQPNAWDCPIALVPADHHAGHLHSPNPHHTHQQHHPQDAMWEGQPLQDEDMGMGHTQTLHVAAGCSLGSGSSGIPELPSPPVPGAPSPATLLAPEKLMPFLIPFMGGRGNMAGGPTRQNISVR